MTSGRSVRRVLHVVLILLFVVTVSPQLLAQDETANGEWRAYAADSAASKYSPLEQITQTILLLLRSSGNGRALIRILFMLMSTERRLCHPMSYLIVLKRKTLTFG
ncbi:MAG: hypothetical protein Ct9H300mP25_14460 [Acidobacteriota bacterium]|nr:MAG: hypothetical protein Ct9H300mP25_14460 [Acidobacteriota bacterium]